MTITVLAMSKKSTASKTAERLQAALLESEPELDHPKIELNIGHALDEKRLGECIFHGFSKLGLK